MAKISEACITAAKSALKTFDTVDLEQYATQVFNRAREYTDTRGAAAIERAINEIGDERAQLYMEEMQRKVNDKAKVEERSNPIKDKKARLLDILVRRKTNLSNNVESSQRAAQKLLMDKFFNILTADETKFLFDDRNAIDIARALDEKDASEAARALAKKFNGYIDTRNSNMVNSGALLLGHINKDRTLRAIHDAGKLLRGGRNLVQSALSGKYTPGEAKKLWRDFIKGQLDLSKTFQETDAMGLNGEIDITKVDSMLDEIFNNITTGKPFLIGGGKRQGMFFYWKDNEAWMRYNQKYGRGSLVNAMRADLASSAKQIGMANMLGSSHTSAYNELAKLENEVHPQSQSIKNAAKLSFNYLAGIDQAPVNPNIASFFGAIRGITGSAKLAGRLTIVSLPDIANGIMFAHRYGYNYFGAYGTYLSGMFNLLKTEERKYIAGLFKEMTDSHQGYFSRFMAFEGTNDVINNFNNIMYRFTAMDALDKGNKVSSLQLMARILGDNAQFEHGALNDTAKGLLNKFNITESEWNGLRRKTVKLNGRKLLTTDSVESLSNDEIRKIYGINNDTPLYQLKNELHRKIYSMFDVASENAVLTPGAFMKASSTLSSQSGTVAGELLRSVLQFKMYPLEFIDRVLLQGMENADGIQNKLKFAAYLFGATLPMSWLTMYMDNYSRGKTMPDWNKMIFSEKANFSSQLLLPGLGLFGSFLDPNNQSPIKAARLLTTPAIQLLYEGMYAPLAVSEGLIEGDQKKVKNAFKNLAKSVMPGQGLPFVSPYMRQMFGDKPYLEPGQKQRFGS